MALRVELIGLYCLTLVTSSDCAVLNRDRRKLVKILNGAIDSSKVDCSCLLSYNV